MKLCVLYVFTLFSGLLFSQEIKEKRDQISAIPILWKPISSGDFSFHEEWSYPLGVYKNQWGQLSCDGICPTAIDAMKDNQGKIYEDSLSAFYQIVDTTHLYHSIKTTSIEMYEFGGTDFIHFEEKDGVLIGVTENSSATHSSLHIRIDGDFCTVWVHYNSILSDRNPMIFYSKQARVLLDPEMYKQGIIKGFFDFRLINDFEDNVPLHWSGFIYSEVGK